jgi:hypothetical protein
METNTRVGGKAKRRRGCRRAGNKYALVQGSGQFCERKNTAESECWVGEGRKMF